MDQLVNQAEQQQLPLQPPAEDTPQHGVEIDEASGTVTEKPAAAADTVTPPVEPPKPRKRANERLTNAIRAADEANQRASAAEERARLAEERAATKSAEAAAAVQSGMENYAQRVTSEADAAQAELESALETGDKTAIAAANRKVAKMAAAEADVDAWRASQPAAGAEPPKPATAPAPQPPSQPQMQPVSEPVREFLQTNSWFNPLKMGEDGIPVMGRDGRPVANPDFDEDMHDAAMIIHKQIIREIKQGKLDTDFVESPEYFARIQSDVAKSFPDAFEGGEEPEQQPARRTPPMAPTRQPVAPATRGAVPGSAKPNGTKFTLDGEQASFVRSLVDNGTMRYPYDHKDPQKRGQKMAYDDAYLQYAKQDKIDQANRQN